MGFTGRITKSTTVRDAEKHLTVPMVTVEVNQTLEEIAEKVTASPACKTLSVVNEAGRLVGVIPVRTVVEDIFVRVMPEEFLASIDDFDNAVDFSRKLTARTAKDLMQTPVWVKMDDNVRDAYERMHQNRLGGLPIVDDKSQVIGYLDMLELVVVWVKAKGE